MARVAIKRSKQLSDKLKALRTATQAPVRAALADGAQDVVNMAKRLVPDGAGSGSYDLGSTITWQFGADEGGGSDVKTGKSAATTVSITAGDKLNPEARFVEFGTSPRNNGGIFAGTEHPGTLAQPFFFPSYRANKKAIQKKLRLAIRGALQKVSRS